MRDAVRDESAHSASTNISDSIAIRGMPNRTGDGGQSASSVEQASNLHDSARGEFTSQDEARAKAKDGQSKRDKKWLLMLERLKIYKEKHGNVFVPIKYPTDPSLGAWVNNQRSSLKKLADGKDTTITTERLELLKIIGLGDETGPAALSWARKRPRTDDTKCSPIEAYNVRDAVQDETVQSASTNGSESDVDRERPNRRIKSCPTGSGGKSAPSVEQASNLRHSARGESTPKDEAKDGQSKRDKKWLAMLERLKTYKDRHGNVFVPIKYPTDPSLGAWVNNQRSSLKKLANGKDTTITAERLELLKSIGLGDETGPAVRFGARKLPCTGTESSPIEASSVRDAVRDDTSQSAYTYGSESDVDRGMPNRHNKSCPTGSGGQSAPSVERASNLHDSARGEFTSQDEAKAKAKDGQSNRDKKWLLMLERLKIYKEKHGNVFVPIKYPTDPSLGAWVNNQRSSLKKLADGKDTTITTERLELLKSIGLGDETGPAVRMRARKRPCTGTKSFSMEVSNARDASQDNMLQSVSANGSESDEARGILSHLEWQ